MLAEGLVFRYAAAETKWEKREAPLNAAGDTRGDVDGPLWPEL